MSATGTLAPAWERMKTLLFPFDISSWLSIGLMVFLVTLGVNSQWNSVNLTGQLPGRLASNSTQTAIESGELAAKLDALLSENIGLLLGIGIPVTVIVLGLVVLFVWLSVRGQLMLAWSVATGNLHVSQAWNATRPHTGSLFKYRLTIELVCVALTMVGLFTIVLATYRLIKHQSAEVSVYLLTLGPIVIAWVLLMFVPTLLLILLESFAIPVMLREGTTASAAMRKVSGLFKQHLGSVIGYLFLRYFIRFAAALAVFVATLITCCLAGLPVIGQALFAPFFVFERAWPMMMLKSVGPEWDPFAPEPPAGAGPSSTVAFEPLY